MPSILSRLFGRTKKPQPPAPRPAPAPSAASSAKSRRNAALAAAQEKIGVVVRDAMTASSILSSAYRFKVLVTAAEPARFAVLVNLEQEQAEGVTQQLFTESLIKRLAASRFQLTVDVVYWHVAKPHVASRPRRPVPAAAPIPVPARPARVALAAAEGDSAVSRLLEAADAPTGFEDTHRPETRSDSDFSPLGATQYGEP